ncbi:MAG: GtrA family protein, partial [Hyphomonas sp.]|nr:GtrA family protein [Hyphomonas sp.]
TAVIFSFLVNARHNFKTTDHTALRFLSFCIVCTIGYGVGYGVIVLTQSFVEPHALAANVGKILSLPVVFVVQFILNSRITFRKTAA